MILYYVRLEGIEGKFYKIGRTLQTIKRRFRAENHLIITVLFELELEHAICVKYEQRLLRRYRTKEKPTKVVLFKGGNNEVFTQDILGLDSI